MKEEFILVFIPQRIKQLGYTTYHLRYRDFCLLAESVLAIPAHNELYFLIGEPKDLTIDSLYGYYDSTPAGRTENTYQHRGEISITNVSDKNQRVKFIQVILVN
jgi:hypothetical protein